MDRKRDLKPLLYILLQVICFIALGIFIWININSGVIKEVYIYTFIGVILSVLTLILDKYLEFKSKLLNLILTTLSIIFIAIALVKVIVFKIA